MRGPSSAWPTTRIPRWTTLRSARGRVTRPPNRAPGWRRRFGPPAPPAARSVSADTHQRRRRAARAGDTAVHGDSLRGGLQPRAGARRRACRFPQPCAGRAGVHPPRAHLVRRERVPARDARRPAGAGPRAHARGAAGRRARRLRIRRQVADAGGGRALCSGWARWGAAPRRTCIRGAEPAHWETTTR
jgi:hypothetical protein